MTNQKSPFVIILTYIKPLEDILSIRPRHVEFLNTHYSNKIFLFSGPQTPRTGGVIIAFAHSKEDLQKIMQQDPFIEEGCASFDIIAFEKNLCLPEIDAVLSTL